MEDANGSTLNVNGINMFYKMRGLGEPLLLLHGMTGCSGDWVYAGQDQFMQNYRLIMPDARGHGRTTNPKKTITHRQCALDFLALLDHLGVEKCRAIGLSLGGNTLLHMATLQPGRIEAMVLVSATMHFPDQARRIMSQVPIENQTPSEWESMRQRHKLGDDQIVTLWEQARALKDSYEDVNFTAPQLATIKASTLIVYGDRDPLYPVEMALTMFRAIPQSALSVIPGAGHLPVFLLSSASFVQTALGFFQASSGA